MGANTSVYEQLVVETAQIKHGSLMPKQALYEVYGKCQMAYQLKALTFDEFMRLNHEVVAEGINNSKYF